MKNLWTSLVSTLLLPQALVAINLGNIGGGATASHVRFFFTYDLPDETTVGTGDVESLLCRTQDFLTKVLNNQFINFNLAVKATSVDWDGTQKNPVMLNFTADVIGANDTEVPDVKDVQDAWSDLNMEEYLNDYVIVSMCPSVFSETSASSFSSKRTPKDNGDGDIVVTEAICQNTCAPTISPGMPTLPPTKTPTAKPTNPIGREAFIDDVDELEQMRPDYTKAPGATNPPVSAANPAYLTPAQLPGEGPSPTPGSSSGTSSGGGSTPGSSDSTSSGGGPTGANGGPTSSSNNSSGSNSGTSGTSNSGGDTGSVAEYSPGGGGGSGSGFGTGTSSGSGGTSASGGSMTGSSLTSTMSTGSSFSSSSSTGGSSSGSSGAGSNAGGGSGASGFGMGANPSGGSGTTSGTSPESGQGAPLEYPAPPEPGMLDSTPNSSDDGTGSSGSSTSSTGASGFGMESGGSSDDGNGNGKPQSSAGSNGFGGGVPAIGTPDGSGPGFGKGVGGESQPISEGPNSQLITTSGPSDMVLVTLQYGFFDGEERDPTIDELESLICFTEKFFSDELDKALNDGGLSVRAKNVDWVYNEGGSKEFELTFAANVKHGSGALVAENEVFQALKVADKDLHSYIVDYVSQVKSPEGRPESVFFSVNEVNLKSAQNVPIPKGRLPQGVSNACYGASNTNEGSMNKNFNFNRVAASNANKGSTSESSTPNRGFNGFGSIPPEEGAITSADGIEVDEDNEELATIHIELGFYDGEYSDPTELEVETFVCRTNSFLEQKVREYLGDSELEVHASNIDWTFGEPFALIFAVRATFGSGRSMASSEAFQALKLSDEDIIEYIVDFVTQSSPADTFANSNEASIKAKVEATLPRGKLLEAECLAAEDKPLDGFGTDANGGEVNSTMSRGVTLPRLPQSDEMDADLDDTDAIASEANNTSRGVTLPGLPEAVVEDSAGGDEGNAADESAPAPPPDNSSAGTQDIDLSRVDPLAGNPASSGQVDSFNLIMGFVNTPASQPTLAEVNALMCEAQKYFTEYLRNHLNDPSLVVALTNIGFSYNADCNTPMNVFFAVEASHPDGRSTNSEEIFHVLRLGEDEILDIIQNYVWKSQPETNVFRSVNQLTFEATMGAASIVPEGTIAQATCSIQTVLVALPAQPSRAAPLAAPLNMPVPALQTSEPAANFRLVFGFYDGMAREPTAVEVHALLCQTILYFEKRLRIITGDFGLQMDGNSIDWVFSSDCPGPVTVTFNVEGMYGDGQAVATHDIFQGLKLGDDEMREYLETAVWQSAPAGISLFSSVNTLSFEDMIGEQIPMPGKIAEVSCLTTQPQPMPPSRIAPLFLPSGNPENPEAYQMGMSQPGTYQTGTQQLPAGTSQSGADQSEMSQSGTFQTGTPQETLGPPLSQPGTSQETSGPPLSRMPAPLALTTTTPEPTATSENAVLYHLEFHFFEGELREPTVPEIEALICKTTEYFEAELQYRSVGECIGEALLTNIAWTYDAGCPNAPFTVSFAARATFCDGQLVPADLLYERLQLTNDEIKDYLEEYIWKTEPVDQTIFAEVNAMTFEGTAGATIRDGMIASVNC